MSDKKIKQFVSNVRSKNLNKAKEVLNNIMDEKIKQRIIRIKTENNI